MRTAPPNAKFNVKFSYESIMHLEDGSTTTVTCTIDVESTSPVDLHGIATLTDTNGNRVSIEVPASYIANLTGSFGDIIMAAKYKNTFGEASIGPSN